MRFEVTILGNGSASPVVGRHQSAHVLNVREQFFLIDCGEGTQERLMRAGVSPLRVKAVFITHTHGDHVFGLLPLISSMGFMGRKAVLEIFGPAGLGRIVDFFVGEMGGVDFPIEFTAVGSTVADARSSDGAGERVAGSAGAAAIFENASMEVFAVPLRHRVPTVGYVFREKQDAAGTVPRSYAYLSDTTASSKAAALARGVDLMYHEATYLDADKRLAVRTGHSTAAGAARVALKAGAGRLVIGHFSARYKDLSPLLDEARGIFPETFLALEGESFSVPATKQL